MATNQIIIEKEQLGSAFICADSPTVRTPSRPKEFRQPGYDEQFDYHCLFYDAFVMDGGSEIRLVGPLLLNLAEYVEAGNATVTDADTDATVPVTNYCLKHMFKVSVLELKLARPLAQAHCNLDFGALGIFTLSAGANQAALFASKRTAFTLFKYEPLSWLVDWAEFNIKYHGVNALLVNHNNCPHASTQEIMRALQHLTGLDTLVVGHWPYLYGPAAGGGGYGWDSDFCQIGLFEQARHKFFSQAEGVLNGDIDELVITEGHASIFELLLHAPEGFIRFGGNWISGNLEHENPSNFQSHKHRDFLYIASDSQDQISTKWIVDPSVCGIENQWRIHGVKALKTPNDLSAQVIMCHFKDINMKWKNTFMGPLVKPVEYAILKEAFRKVGWLKEVRESV